MLFPGDPARGWSESAASTNPLRRQASRPGRSDGWIGPRGPRSRSAPALSSTRLPAAANYRTAGGGRNAASAGPNRVSCVPSCRCASVRRSHVRNHGSNSRVERRLTSDDGRAKRPFPSSTRVDLRSSALVVAWTPRAPCRPSGRCIQTFRLNASSACMARGRIYADADDELDVPAPGTPVRTTRAR